MSTEWTDEKHSLFLKSIETSFVHQLYRSINSSGLHSQSQSKLSSHMRSSKHKTSRAADQVWLQFVLFFLVQKSWYGNA